MKRICTLITATVLTVASVGAEEIILNPANLRPGTVIRIAAERPVVNLAKADVVRCTTNTIIVRHKRDKFTIAQKDIYELVVLQPGPELPATEASESPAGTNAAAVPTAPSSAKTNATAHLQTGDASSTNKPMWETVWSRIKGLWQ